MDGRGGWGGGGGGGLERVRNDLPACKLHSIGQTLVANLSGFEIFPGLSTHFSSFKFSWRDSF